MGEMLQEAIDKLDKLIESMEGNTTDYDGQRYALQVRIERDAYIEVLRGQACDVTQYATQADIDLYLEKRREAESLVGKRDEREANP